MTFRHLGSDDVEDLLPGVARCRVVSVNVLLPHDVHGRVKHPQVIGLEAGDAPVRLAERHEAGRGAHLEVIKVKDDEVDGAHEAHGVAAKGGVGVQRLVGHVTEGEEAPQFGP